VLRAVLALLLAATVTAACAANETDSGSPSTSTVGQAPTPPTATTAPVAGTIEIDERVPFTDLLVLDVLRPAGDDLLPVVVLVHGGGWVGGERSDVADLAALLANQGAIVYNISYRTIALGGSYPGTFEDISCGVRFARNTALSNGGDPGRVALVGYSAGAHLGAVVALAGDEFKGDCLTDGGSSLPDAFVGIAGPYDSDQFSPLLIPFFGGAPAEVPEAWAAGNPYTYVDRRPDLRMHLLQGTADRTVPQQSTLDFHEAVTGAGHEVQLTVVEGADHRGMVDPSASGAIVAEAVLEILR
jgi:acetyl esterase/lipase